jgi:hypothetical protein
MMNKGEEGNQEYLSALGGKNEGEEKIINKKNEKVFQKNNSGHFDS